MKTTMKREHAPRWTFKIIHEDVEGLGCLPYPDPQENSWYSWVSPIHIEGRLKFIYSYHYEKLGLLFMKAQVYK